MASQIEHENSHFPVKLFIRDVLQLSASPDESDYYQFRGQELRAVDILGVVTECRQYQDFYIYKVDDCSGVINCKHNIDQNTMRMFQEISRFEERTDGRLDESEELNMALKSILKQSKKILLEKSKPLQQGDCAHIQGFVKEYFGDREIIVFNICKVSDKDEIDRAHEMDFIYTNVYDKIQPSVDLTELDKNQDLSALYSSLYTQAVNE